MSHCRSYWLGRFGSSALAIVGGFFEREKAEYSQELGSAKFNVRSDVSRSLALADAVPKKGDDGIYDPYNNDQATASTHTAKRTLPLRDFT